MNSKTIGAIVGVVAAIILIVGAYTVIAGFMSGRGGTSNLDALSLDSSLSVGTTFSAGATTTIGAQGAPAYLVAGGIDEAYVQAPFSATSSSPAILRNPFGATTTVRQVQSQITANPLGGAITYDISTTTNCTGGNASSTPAFVYAHSVASGAQDTLTWTPQLIASTSAAVAGRRFTTEAALDGSNPFTLGPSECLSIRIASSTPGTFGSYLTGTFSALFAKP